MRFLTEYANSLKESTPVTNIYSKELEDIRITSVRKITNIPPYKEIDKLLNDFTQTIDRTLKQNLIGIYLTGSLSYGGFNSARSDIDLVTVFNHPSNLKELELIKILHKEIENDYPIWSERLECSYIAADMLNKMRPPTTPRPYYNNKTFYENALYGNEWIINKYLLYEYAIPLIGPQFRTLTSQVGLIEVKKACIRDLFEEWIPKIKDHKFLDDSHCQSYTVLNLCRILYSIMQHPTGSKAEAASWVKNEFGLQWQGLIENAEQWQYGKEMHCREEVISFAKSVANKVLEIPLSTTPGSKQVSSS